MSVLANLIGAWSSIISSMLLMFLLMILVSTIFVCVDKYYGISDERFFELWKIKSFAFSLFQTMLSLLYTILLIVLFLALAICINPSLDITNELYALNPVYSAIFIMIGVIHLFHFLYTEAQG